jgi:hypothetical protein
VLNKRLVWPLFALVMGFFLGGSLVWGIMYVPPQQHTADNNQASDHPPEKVHKGGFWEKTIDDPVAYFTLWLVGFTGVLAVSTIGLWIVTWRASVSQARDMKASIAAAEKSGEIARDAMIAGERAFVFTTGVLPLWDLETATGLYHWRFRPNWRNSGDTPTRKMTMHTECILRDSALPLGFDFDYFTTETGTALIPPNSTLAAAWLPDIQPQQFRHKTFGTCRPGTSFFMLWDGQGTSMCSPGPRNT